ncbi:MAG: InlB B-repeat-containing protein, partial [Clostridia bacterium]|nr:InlB B-repeat-containing protein [Clostridia bacterium]
MSKAKKIISMLLAIAMVLTVAPVSLLASAADYEYKAPEFTENEFTVSTSATEVIRVAAGANSFSLGNTIVSATPSGIPASNGTYRSVAYAGETPSFPTVTFSITGKKLAGEPVLTITGASPSKGNAVVTENGSTTTYTWTLTGGTATAGADVIYQFDYTVGTIAYTSYAFAHVENIIVMNGFESYRDNAGSTSYSTDSTRHALIVQYQSKNMYTYMDPDQTNRVKGYINYALTTSVSSGSLEGCGSEDDFFNTATAYGSSVPNDYIGGEEVAALIKSSIDSPDEKNGSWQNMCTAVDTNRGNPTVYLDIRDENISSLNLRMTMQNADSEEWGGAYVSGVYYKSGHVAFGTNDSGFSSDINNAIYVASGTGSGNSIGSSDYYGSVMVKFAGTGPTAISEDTDGDGNINKTEYTVITAFRAARGDTYNYGAGGMHLDFTTYDTRDLYALIQGINSGSGTYDCQTASFPGTTLVFDKGANPQERMYASGWSAFIDAYKIANSVLVKPDTNQAEIDEVATDLWLAYTKLSGYNANVTYEVKHVLNDGTNTEIIPAQTGTKPAGTTMVAYPATITGYEVDDKSPQTKVLSGNEATVTATFLYNANTYYVNTFSLASAGTKDIPATYKQEISKSTFEYGTKDYYTFDGWFYDKDVWEDPVPDTFLMPANDVNVYAKWVPTPIVFECILMTSDGQELGRKNYSVTPNTDPLISTPLARPDNDLPSHEGYLFVEFYDNFNAETGEFSNQTAWPKRFVIGDSGQTIYARMVNVDGKIVFETNGGNNIPDSTFTAPAQVDAPANPVKEGYDFAGWYKDAKLTDGPISWPVQMNNATGFVAYAAWAPQMHSISFELGEPETKYDTKTENMPVLSGLTDTVIPAKDYPPAPLKFGYVFDGWSLNGERFELDGATYPKTDIVLEPIWRATKYSAFADITAYEKLSGSYIETESASVGDVVTFRMTTQTNFTTGSSVFIFMYDSNFFELVDEGTNAFVLNKNNEYVSGINAKFQGVTDDSVLPWPEFERTVTKEDGSTAYYKAMMIAIDPTVSMDDFNCEPMSDGEWLVEFQLKVKSGATGEGKVFMDNAWTRTPDNIMGTMFYGWGEDSETSVAETQNSVVEPNLDNAYAIIEIDEVVPEDTTVILNSDGGTWSDGSTDNITYAGRAETEILDDAVPTRNGAATAIRGYAAPEKLGYHLDETSPWLSDAGDVWAEGYYAAADKTGTEYKANWAANTYEVNYYVDGNLVYTEEALYAEKMAGPTTLPTKTGYVFADWVDAEVNGNVVDLSTATCPIDGLNLYATWAPATDTPYTIKITYYNPIQEKNAETTVSMTGTTDSTVSIVETVPGTPEANTVYLTPADLPVVANGNYVFDSEN